MIFHWPQYVWASLMLVVLLCNVAASAKEGSAARIIFSLATAGGMFWLLYEGGFFAGAGA